VRLLKKRIGATKAIVYTLPATRRQRAGQRANQNAKTMNILHKKI